MGLKKRIRLIRILFLLIYDMIKNLPLLSEDIENNFMVCKRICHRILAASGAHIETEGSEKLPDTRFLLVANHRCFFDVVILLAALERPVRFVAAKELCRYPLLRRYLLSMQCIFIDRNTRDFRKIKRDIGEISRALDQNDLVLFPEGQCTYGRKKMGRFKRGGFMGTAGKDIWIVPCFIKIDSFENIGRWMIPEGEVRVVTGVAFRPEEAESKNVSGAKSGALAAYAWKQVHALQQKTEG